MQRNPFFSVIIPTYNRGPLLKIAVESALAQTFADYELIIVDDGSTDNTPTIIQTLYSPQSIVHRPKIRYIYQSHQGVTPARNRGIKEAQGEFICFLDSDDRFRADKLQITYDCIKKYPQYKIFHTEEIWYRNGTYLPQKKYHKKPSGYVFGQAAKLCCISISTAAIHKSVFKNIGLFDETLPACEDYDFWLRTTAKYPVCLIPEYLTIKQGGLAGQQSKKYPAMDKFRIYALQKILQSPSLSKENYQAAYTELKNKCNIYIQGASKRGKTKEVNHYRNLISQFENPQPLPCRQADVTRRYNL